MASTIISSIILSLRTLKAAILPSSQFAFWKPLWNPSHFTEKNCHHNQITKIKRQSPVFLKSVPLQVKEAIFVKLVAEVGTSTGSNCKDRASLCEKWCTSYKNKNPHDYSQLGEYPMWINSVKRTKSFRLAYKQLLSIFVYDSRKGGVTTFILMWVQARETGYKLKQKRNETSISVSVVENSSCSAMKHTFVSLNFTLCNLQLPVSK